VGGCPDPQKVARSDHANRRRMVFSDSQKGTVHEIPMQYLTDW
jgi:hypothetical protein